MSPSSQQSARLTVKSALGVEVRILDGRLSEIERSDTDISREMKPGIYTVRWIAGETTAQKVIRLREGDDPTLYLDVLVPGSGPSEDLELAARQFDALVEAISRRRSSRLTIFVCSNDQRTTADVGGNVELRRVSDHRSSSHHGAVEPQGHMAERPDGWSVAHYDCDGGLYALRYLSSDRATIEQTLFLPDERHTVVWLRYGSALTTEQRDGDLKYRARRGINPARTRIVSLGFADDAQCLRERFLLCDHLVDALLLRHGTVKESISIGVERQSDPFLKLLAAAALLTRPVAPDDDWVERADNAMAAPAGNVTRAERLVDELRPEAHYWPDVACLDWRAGLALGNQQSTFYAISAPPMLEVAWRWAAAWTVLHPVAIDTSRDRSLLAVAKGQERSTPWLSWRAADLRSKVFPENNPPPGLSELGVEIIGELTAQINIAAASRRATVDLSEQTRDLLETASRVANRETWNNASQQLLSRLAGATGLPLGTLVEAAQVAVDELRRAGRSATDETLLTSDPNKGMFGGKASRNGYKVSLEGFEPTNSPEFLALEITVRGSKARPLTGPVWLFLHPTFSPPTQVIAPVDGVATHLCYAWGGFTLGVELASGERLELDLAQDERLPERFRSR